MFDISNFFSVLRYFWWIILPPIFYYVFKVLWIDFVAAYSKNSWLAKQTWTFLEIIPPKDIERSPKPMESVFAGMAGAHTGYHTFEQFKNGAFWHDRFSLEIVGKEGQMHFYIRCQKKYRNLVEANIYAQYPEAEVTEVEDYTISFPKVIPTKYWDLWGADFQYVSPDIFPIKTYDKFEETLSGTMIDPLAALSEVIGALPPGQHIWLQYIIQPLPESWKKEAAQQEALNKVTGRGAAPSGGVLDDLTDVLSNVWNGIWGPVEFKAAEKKEQQPLEFRLTPSEKDVLKGVEEKLGRNVFKVKIRFIYLGKRENFQKPFVSATVGAIKQFSDLNSNQLKPEEISKTYGKIFFTKARADFRKRKLYSRYRKRNMDDVKMIMSVKELATLFHFPDMSVKSPSVPRVASKLGGAPPNLPVE